MKGVPQNKIHINVKKSNLKKKKKKNIWMDLDLNPRPLSQEADVLTITPNSQVT
jgi:hypothetical protein